ncbi:hypothetical protein KIPB_013771, partial [Kipferlia bialata]
GSGGDNTNTLYAFGGRQDGGPRDYSVQRIDLATGVCSRDPLDDMEEGASPPSRPSPLVFEVEGHLVMTGSSLHSTREGHWDMCKGTWVYSLDTSRQTGSTTSGTYGWREVGPAPTVYCDLMNSVAVVGNTAYVTSSGNMHSFTLEGGWKDEGPSPASGKDIFMALGHHVYAIPWWDTLYRYDTLSGKWEDCGKWGVMRANLSAMSCKHIVGGIALIPVYQRECMSVSLDSSLMYPHPDMRWAWSKPGRVWVVEE